MNRKVIFLSCCVAGLMGCNPQKDNNPITNAVEAVKDVKLQGTFFNDCTLAGPVAQATSLHGKRISYQFAGTNVTRATTYYESNQCTGNAAYTLTEVGQFDIQTDKQTADGARFIDIDLKNLNVEINSQAGADEANKISMCSAKDWAVGQKRDVTPHSKEALCLGRQVPVKDLNVYRIEGNVLFMGNTTLPVIGKDQGGRPTSLDRNGMKFSKGS